MIITGSTKVSVALSIIIPFADALGLNAKYSKKNYDKVVKIYNEWELFGILPN